MPHQTFVHSSRSHTGHRHDHNTISLQYLEQLEAVGDVVLVDAAVAQHGIGQSLQQRSAVVNQNRLVHGLDQVHLCGQTTDVTMNDSRLTDNT